MLAMMQHDATQQRKFKPKHWLNKRLERRKQNPENPGTWPATTICRYQVEATSVAHMELTVLRPALLFSTSKPRSLSRWTQIIYGVHIQADRTSGTGRKKFELMIKSPFPLQHSGRFAVFLRFFFLVYRALRPSWWSMVRWIKGNMLLMQQNDCPCGSVLPQVVVRP